MHIKYFLWLFFVTSVFAEEILVTVAPLKEIWVYPIAYAPASVVSVYSSTISSEITGKVVNVSKDVGEIVEQEEVLAVIDCENYTILTNQAKAQLNALQAQLNLAAIELKRSKKLLQNKTISQEVLDQSQAQYNNMSAQYMAQNQLVLKAELDQSRCEIKAPYAAVITERLVQLGNFVTLATPLFKLQSLDLLEVQATIPQSKIKAFSQAEKIWFASKDFLLKIKVISPVVTNENRLVRFNFLNNKALIGVQDRVYWQEINPYIPASFIVKREDKLGFFIAKNSQAIFIPLPHAQLGHPAMIDFSENTQIIVDGRYSVQNGQTIKMD